MNIRAIQPASTINEGNLIKSSDIQATNNGC